MATIRRLFGVSDCVATIRGQHLFLAFSLLPGEPDVNDCNVVDVKSSCQSDIYLGRCGHARAHTR